MPYRRRYRRRAPRRRFRRRYKGKKLRIPKSINTGYLYIKQKATSDVLIPPDPVGGQLYVPAVKTFQLSDLSQPWGNIFDQFRIVGVKCTFWCTSNLPGVSTNPLMLYTSVDLDGQNPLPGSEADLLQRSNVKQRQLTFGGSNPQYHQHYLKPRTAKAIYSGGVLSAYGLDTPKTWLDIRSANNAPHYGLLHAYVAPSGNSNPIPLRIQTTYYLQFRKVI